MIAQNTQRSKEGHQTQESKQIIGDSVDDNTEHTIRIIQRDSVTTNSNQYTTREKGGEIEMLPISEFIKKNSKESSFSHSQKFLLESSNFDSNHQKLGTMTHIDYNTFQEERVPDYEKEVSDDDFSQNFSLNMYNEPVNDHSGEVKGDNRGGNSNFNSNFHEENFDSEEKEIIQKLESKEMREYIEVLKESIGEIYEEKIKNLKKEFKQKEKKNLEKIEDLETKLNEKSDIFKTVISESHLQEKGNSEKIKSLQKKIEDLEEENGLLLFRVQGEKGGMRTLEMPGFESTVKEKKKFIHSTEKNEISRLKTELESAKEKLKLFEENNFLIENNLREKYQVLEENLTKKFKNETSTFFENIQKEMEDILSSKGLTKKKLKEIEIVAKEEIKKEIRNTHRGKEKEVQVGCMSLEEYTPYLGTGGSSSTRKSKHDIKKREDELEKSRIELIEQKNHISRQNSLVSIKLKKLQEEKRIVQELRMNYEEKVRKLNTRVSISKTKEIRDMELEFRKEINDLSDEVDRLREELDSCYEEIKMYKLKETGENGTLQVDYNHIGNISTIEEEGLGDSSFQENRSLRTDQATKSSNTGRSAFVHNEDDKVPETVRTELVMLPNTDEPTFGSRISSQNFNSRQNVNPFNSHSMSKDPNDTSNFGYLSKQNSKQYGSKILDYQQESENLDRMVKVEELTEKSKEKKIMEYLKNSQTPDDYLYKSQENSTLELIENPHRAQSRFSSPEYQNNLEYSNNKESSYNERIKILGGESTPETPGNASNMSYEGMIGENSSARGHLIRMMKINKRYKEDSAVRLRKNSTEISSSKGKFETRSSYQGSQTKQNQRKPFFPLNQNTNSTFQQQQNENIFFQNQNNFNNPQQQELMNLFNQQLATNSSQFNLTPSMIYAWSKGKNLSSVNSLPQNCFAGLTNDQIQQIMTNEYIASMVNLNKKFECLTQSFFQKDSSRNTMPNVESKSRISDNDDYRLSLNSSSFCKTEDSYRKSVRSYVKKILNVGENEKTRKKLQKNLEVEEFQKNNVNSNENISTNLPSYSNYFDVNILDLIFNEDNGLLEDTEKTRKLKALRNDINNIWIRDNKLFPKIVSKLEYLSNMNFLRNLDGVWSKKKMKINLENYVKEKFNLVENLWKDNFVSYQCKLKFLRELKKVKKLKIYLNRIKDEIHSLKIFKEKNNELLQSLGIRETVKNRFVSLCSKYKSREQLKDMLGNLEGKGYLDQLKFISSSILRLVRQLKSRGVKKYRGVSIEALVKLDLWEIDYVKKMEEIVKNL